MNDHQYDHATGSSRMLGIVLVGGVAFWVVVILAFASCHAHGAVQLPVVSSCSLHRASASDCWADSAPDVKAPIGTASVAGYCLPSCATAGTKCVGTEQPRQVGRRTPELVCSISVPVARTQTAILPRMVLREKPGTSTGEWEQYSDTAKPNWYGCGSGCNAASFAGSNPASPSNLFAHGTGPRLASISDPIKERVSSRAKQTAETHENLRTLLSALAQIESGNNPHAIGRAGEISEYQILPAVWLESARRLGRDAALRNPSASRATLIAAYHLGVIQKRLQMALHREAGPSELYAVWRLGFDGFKRRGFNLSRCPASVRDGARRFNNLLEQ